PTPTWRCSSSPTPPSPGRWRRAPWRCSPPSASSRASSPPAAPPRWTRWRRCATSSARFLRPRRADLTGGRMDYHPLHPWQVPPREAAKIQTELRERVVLHAPADLRVRTVAGADISMDRGSDRGYGAIVVL